MFQAARLRLTLWYLLIIFVVSGLFSVAFYHASTREIHRIISRVQEMQEEWQGRSPRFAQPPPGAPSLEELQAAKKRLLANLVVINGIILLGAGGAAYFLAGKTLTPIQLMVDEQNQFISNASHELRTPLSTLRAELEGSLLEQHISHKKARLLIASNLEEVGRLQALSNTLLQLAHLHNLLPTSFAQKVPLKDVIEAAVKQVRALAAAKHIDIFSKLDEVVVQGNTESLSELFVILLDNAIKYSHEKSKIMITTNKGNDQVVIGLQDWGVGIPEEDIPHIFDRFYRSDKSRSQTQGFGLGLSIAKHIVEKHNGTINVISDLGKGSTFSISLPLTTA